MNNPGIYETKEWFGNSLWSDRLKCNIKRLLTVSMKVRRNTLGDDSNVPFRSVHDRTGEERDEVLEMLFEDESIFPKMRNFIMGNVGQNRLETDAKLSACKRPEEFELKLPRGPRRYGRDGHQGEPGKQVEPGFPGRRMVRGFKVVDVTMGLEDHRNRRVHEDQKESEMERNSTTSR
ncbi:unnamed protein product [Litomosoides sigmodontis]|uniref:Uncharacterized protein n=1 Tax=Litomosoides sigmodontis TaxID=42156 RepID=A0A3P7JMN2_LITSI|nr:unnamed protein product [Litomosoides sigmodontis]